MEDERRTILVCGLGTSPQVVTETVQCLNEAYEKYPRVGELYIFTTTEGRKHVEALRSELDLYCKEFRVDPPARWHSGR
jgi:CRISPR-associated protein (TIGR02584 family)